MCSSRSHGIPGCVRPWTGAEEAALLRVTPGFGAVAVPAGVHDVSVRYRPGPLQPRSSCWEPVCSLRARGPSEGREPPPCKNRPSAGSTPARRDCGRLGGGGLWPSPCSPSSPCGRAARTPDRRARRERGLPPRLVEFARAVSDGQLPPIWAPDLGNGYGQPLFEFAPPLVYAAALPLPRPRRRPERRPAIRTAAPLPPPGPPLSTGLPAAGRPAERRLSQLPRAGSSRPT